MDVTNEAYELRPEIGADHDAVAEVWHSSASLPGVGPPVMPTLAELRDRVHLEIAGGWALTVAVRAHRVVGFTTIKPRQAVLDQLFVQPGLIGGGVGRALLAHSMSAMPTGFTLFTASTNTRARRFYEKAGLVHLRDAAHPQTGHPVSHYGWNVR